MSPEDLVRNYKVSRWELVIYRGRDADADVAATGDFTMEAVEPADSVEEVQRLAMQYLKRSLFDRIDHISQSLPGYSTESVTVPPTEDGVEMVVVPGSPLDETLAQLEVDWADAQASVVGWGDFAGLEPGRLCDAAQGADSVYFLDLMLDIRLLASRSFPLFEA